MKIYAHSNSIEFTQLLVDKINGGKLEDLPKFNAERIVYVSCNPL